MKPTEDDIVRVRAALIMDSVGEQGSSREHIVTAILEHTRSGEWRWDQADAIAARLGIGPLEFEPNVIDFDPWQVAFWRLPLVLAWIASRSEDQVRAMWPEYRERCRWWDEIQHQGPDGETIPSWDILPGKAETIPGLALDWPVREAFDELRLRLVDGDLKATAVPYGGGRSHIVSADDWRNLKLEPRPNFAEGLTFTGDLSPAYVEVELDSRRLREFWPPFDPAKPAQPTRVANLKGRDGKKTRYPPGRTEKWAREFFRSAEDDPSIDHRRDEGFGPELEKAFPNISATVRNDLHKRFGPKPRSKRGT